MRSDWLLVERSTFGDESKLTIQHTLTYWVFSNYYCQFLVFSSPGIVFLHGLSLPAVVSLNACTNTQQVQPNDRYKVTQ